MDKPFFKRPRSLLALGGILLLTMVFSLRCGSVALSSSDFWGGLFRRPGQEYPSLVLYYIRLPRMCGAILAGAGLSVAGVLLQSVTANPLAGPNIIGVNSGAGLTMILLLYFAPQALHLAPLAAFLGAFATTMLIVSLANRIQGSHTTIILAGIAITTVFSAGISLISLLDSDVLATYNYFSVGSLAALTIEQLPLPAAIISLALAVSCLLRRRINILCLGDSLAHSLGVRVRRLRLVCLMLASAAAAAVVYFAGLLGFVGLVVPHIGRKLCGNEVGHLLPVSALSGAILVLLADTAGRLLFAPSELPVGIVMAFIGGPFFFWLLFRRKHHAQL